jgi:hypothetical protein
MPVVSAAIITLNTDIIKLVTTIRPVRIKIFGGDILNNNETKGIERQSGKAKQIYCENIFAKIILLVLHFKKSCSNIPVSISRLKILYDERFEESMNETIKTEHESCRLKFPEVAKP